MPRIAGTIISGRLATLRELETWYSFDDALDLLEIILVDRRNALLAAEELAAATRKNR